MAHLNVTPIMHLPPILQPVIAAQTFTGTGTVDPETLIPGASTELVFSLPLPAGFTISSTSEWSVVLPPGFTLPSGSSEQPVSFFGLSPYQFNAVLNPPSTLGPTAEPLGVYPAGTLWVWSALNNQSEYGNITLEFILQYVINPSATGPTGNFTVQIGGTGQTLCVFTVPGITIAND